MPVERGKDGAHADCIGRNLAVIHPSFQNGLAELRFIEAAISYSKSRTYRPKSDESKRGRTRR
jgi:hypothetical protein